MTRQVCLSIGIGEAESLDFLPGARNGANAVADWARRANFEQVTLLTDEKAPVEIEDVRKALMALLPRNRLTDRLIIYFGGHGLARDGTEDFWLLSKWRQRGEAILVAGLRRRLDKYGVQQLVMISDACRVLPNGTDATDMTEDRVIDRGFHDARIVQTDLLRASSAYKAAYMLEDESGDIESDRCIFTSLLTEVLDGVHTDAFETIEGRERVTSDSLATFLESEVPKVASRYGLTLQPDILSGLRRPNDIYLEGKPANPPVHAPWPPTASAAIPQGMDATATPRRPGPGQSWSTQPGMAEPELAPSAAPVINIDPDSVAGGASISLPAPEEIASRASRSGGRLGSLMKAGLDLVFGSIVSRTGPRSIAAGSSFDLPSSRLPSRRATPAAPESLQPSQEPLRAPASDPFDENRLTRSRELVARIKARALEREQRPQHYETGAGFALFGGHINDIFLDHGVAERDLPPPEGAEDTLRSFAEQRPDATRQWYRIAPGPDGLDTPYWQGSYRLKEPLSLLVRLADGKHVGAVLMPSFILSISTDDSGAWSVILRPEWRDKLPETEQIVLEMRDRSFPRDRAQNLLARFMESKIPDPIMGIRAAYLNYDLANNDGVHAIAERFAEKGLAIPFDIALLGRLDVARSSDGLLRAAIADHADVSIAGAFPWFRQGWALMDQEGEGELYPAGLAELASELRPAPFTTLSARGGKKLAAMLFGR